jgi:hypothetical protein
VTIEISSDGNQLGWVCSYCLDPAPTTWLPADTRDVMDALNQMDRVHFADAHTPPALRDSVLRSEGWIDAELVRQAVSDLAVKATEREQQWAKEVLGIDVSKEARRG